jgi:hypothetical protein
VGRRKLSVHASDAQPQRRLSGAPVVYVMLSIAVAFDGASALSVEVASAPSVGAHPNVHACVDFIGTSMTRRTLRGVSNGLVHAREREPSEHGLSRVGERRERRRRGHLRGTSGPRVGPESGRSLLPNRTVAMRQFSPSLWHIFTTFHLHLVAYCFYRRLSPTRSFLSTNVMVTQDQPDHKAHQCSTLL